MNSREVLPKLRMCLVGRLRQSGMHSEANSQPKL